MKIRYYNGKILTLTNEDIITTGELWTEGDTITYIGSGTTEKPVFDREVNLKGSVLMPGFKNAHTHSGMTLLRSFADDLPLQKWLYGKVFPIEAKLTPDDVHTFSKLAIMEYLTSGITANFDMYYFPEAIAAASTECGFRTVLCGAVNNFKESVPLLSDYYNKYNSYNDLISYKLGFHAEYTTSQKIMQDIAELSKSLKAPVYMHNSETKVEVSDCVDKYGKTPTALFKELGLFDFGGAGFHSIYLNDEDLEIYKQKKVFAVTCPASNAKLASGIAPISKCLELGIPVALGTDGPASNNALDMFREMYLVTALQKLKMENPAACPAIDVLKMATINSSNAMGLYDCDTLAVGKKADMVLINLAMPNMQPINDIVKNIVFSGSKINVKMTIVGGKILYEDGVFHINCEPSDIYKKANKIINGYR